MNVIGHNNPPDMADTAAQTAKDMSGWMAESPIIDSEESAKEAKVYLDRGKLCIKDLEDERDGKVRPLNEQVREINAHYRGPRDTLTGVLSELERRFSAFLRREEEKRMAAAREAARIAEEAEKKARAAEQAEQEAIASVDSGELGIDIAAKTAEANQAFDEFKRADRKAALADRETKVKIGGGFSRAVSLRQKETLVIVDMVQAIKATGLTESIRDAILTSARAYKRLHGKYPPGIEATVTRDI